MPTEYKGTTVPEGGDPADGPKAFRDFVDGGVIPTYLNIGALPPASPSVVDGDVAVAKWARGVDPDPGNTWSEGMAFDGRTLPYLCMLADGGWKCVLTPAQLRIARPAGNWWGDAGILIEGSTGGGRIWANMAFVTHGYGGCVWHFEHDHRLHLRDANVIPAHKGIVAAQFAVASSAGEKEQIAAATPGTTTLPADLGGRTWDPAAEIKTLQPKTFKRKTSTMPTDPTQPNVETTGPTELGLVADDVRTQAPELLVHEDADATNGVPASDSIDLMALVTTLVGAVQQLTAKVEVLEAKVP